MLEVIAQIKEKSEIHYLLTIDNLDSEGVTISDPAGSQTEPTTIRFTFDDGEQIHMPAGLLLDLALSGVSPHILPKTQIN